MIGRILLAPFRPVAAALSATARTVRRHPWISLGVASGGVAALAAVGLAFTFEGLPVVSIQRGFRGVGMLVQYNPRTQGPELEKNRVEAPLPAAVPANRPSSAAYKSIQVLGDVDANEFLRLMAAFQQWVGGDVGCAYCHSLVNMADDKLYKKDVARHMIEMTRYINTNWKVHVGETGVTCGTCHRGAGIPPAVWHTEPPPGGRHGMADTASGKNAPSPAAGLTSLPFDPFTPFLLGAAPIRVQATTALPQGTSNASVKQTDWTYALMVHMAEALGVSCNFCHNTRAFGEWDQSTPQRLTAWHGIAMVRDLNNTFMEPITGLFPAARRGPYGDVAKINCGTCHQGAYKPYYGASTLDSYPELKGPAPEASPPGARAASLPVRQAVAP